MSTVNSEIRFAVQAPSYITSNPSKVLASGEPIFFNNGTYVFGDGTTALNALTVYGSSGTWGSITGTLSNQTDLQNALNAKLDSTTAALTYQPIGSYLTSSAIGVTVQGYSANTTLLGNSTTGSGSIVLATSPTFGTDITTPKINGVSGTLSFANANQSSGAVTSFSFTAPNNTGQTASTNIPNFRVNGSTKTWAAGTITNQYWNYFTNNTAAFTSPSTITNSYGLYVEAATAGTNATITYNWGLGVSGSAAVGGKLFVTSTLGSIPEGYDLEVNKSVSGGVESLTRNTSNGSASFARTWVRGDGSQQLNMIVYSSGFTPAGLILQNSVALYTGGTSVSNLLIGHYSASREIHFLSGSTTSAIHTMNRGGQTSGAYSNFEWSPVSNTGQTASTEISGYLYNSYSRQWASGAINTQRERYYKTVTYAFASASTITNAYGAYFEAPTAGTNATITNNYAAGFGGNETIVYKVLPMIRIAVPHPYPTL